MLQSVIEYYRVLQSIAKYYRVLQKIPEYYRVFLAHLLGPLFGLVFMEGEIAYFFFQRFRRQVDEEEQAEDDFGTILTRYDRTHHTHKVLPNSL